MSNAVLIAHGCCPLLFRMVTADEYRVVLLLFCEQNNFSAFKRIFFEQIEFAAHVFEKLIKAAQLKM